MSKIFVVEDEKTIRDELSIFLSRYGYEVEAPEDFENIIENIKGSNCDLILLDINLPVFDGYYICREVRKFSDVPIIVVTSRDSNIDELKSMNLGAYIHGYVGDKLSNKMFCVNASHIIEELPYSIEEILR